MRTGQRLSTDSDRRAYDSLHHVLRPEYHHLIDDWMKTASDIEKRGASKLAQIAEPTLTAVVGRPRASGHEPHLREHPWYHRKHPPAMMQGATGPMSWPVRETMSRSASGPTLRQMQMMMMGQEEAPPLSWQLEDDHETSQICKPGGYVVKLKDSVTIQRMKNAERNKGTYKLFGGSFDGTTTQGAVHNLRSIGQDPFEMPGH